MGAMYAFDVVGEVLFRVSGSEGHPPVPCVVLTTKARRQADGRVIFVELATGHDAYEFPRWFADWNDEVDNFLVNGSVVTGRSVEIAVPRIVYDIIIESGRSPGREYVIGGNQERRAQLVASRKSAAHHWYTMVQSPIAAIRIAGEWVFPVYADIPLPQLLGIR